MNLNARWTLLAGLLSGLTIFNKPVKVINKINKIKVYVKSKMVRNVSLKLNLMDNRMDLTRICALQK